MDNLNDSMNVYDLVATMLRILSEMDFLILKGFLFEIVMFFLTYYYILLSELFLRNRNYSDKNK